VAGAKRNEIAILAQLAAILMDDTFRPKLHTGVAKISIRNGPNAPVPIRPPEAKS